MKYYSSFKLSKKLKEAGCELKSEYWWARWDKHLLSNNGIVKENNCENSYTDEVLYETKYIFSRINKTNRVLSFKSYHILEDICVRYAKEFFGEEGIELHSFHYGSALNKYYKNYEEAYLYHSRKILRMLQQDKPQKLIEDYIIANSVFFKNKNKGKDE